MDYAIFKENVHFLINYFDKLPEPKDKIDNVSILKKIEELEKYLNETDSMGAYKELLEFDFHKTLIIMLRTFVDRNDLNLMNIVLKFASSLTEYSEEFCEALVKENLPDLLISVTINCGDKTFLSHFQDSKAIDTIIYYLLHITYHIIRHIRFHQCFLTHKNISQFKQTIQPWLSSKIINTKILATFVITWLSKEDSDDKNVIEKHADVIRHVCGYIEEVLKTKEKYYRGYCLWELLFGLQALTSIDSIKAEIINTNGFVSSLISIINSDKSETKEIETSLEILWSLTFIEKNRDILREKYCIEDIVKPLSKSKSFMVRKKVKGILWELLKKRKIKTDDKDVKYDIFISYSHAQKEQISKLAAILQTKFKVWIDINNMMGSGLNDMATGIEQSTIFLMAVSSNYKQSQCCRSEANWAFKLNKPIVPVMMVHKYSPDGWLGMMISSETYINFSEQCDYKEATEKIIKQISYKCNQIKMEANPSQRLSDNRHDNIVELKDGDRSSPELPGNIREWNTDDVIRWLTKHKLSHLQSKFVDFNGGMLLALKNMMEKTYEKYNDNMEKKFEMSLTDILKFDSALSSLNI